LEKYHNTLSFTTGERERGKERVREREEKREREGRRERKRE